MKPTNQIDLEFAERVACAYQDMKHTPNETQTRQAYLHLAVETMQQYETVLKIGLIVEFEQNLYKTPNGALLDIELNNHLFVTPTDDNFGSSKFDPKGNPLLNYSGFNISEKPARINDLFRVVHDYFGHYKGANGFRALGEENAYRFHCEMFSPLAIKALTTETRGQNSWLNFGPHGEQNRTAKQDKTIFADQKTGLLPDFCYHHYL